jgi:hypothetical protein
VVYAIALAVDDHLLETEGYIPLLTLTFVHKEVTM